MGIYALSDEGQGGAQRKEVEMNTLLPSKHAFGAGDVIESPTASLGGSNGLARPEAAPSRSEDATPPSCAQVPVTGHGTPTPDPDDAHPVYCLVTGLVTARPKRGPRSQYVSREVQNLRSRISQVETGVVEAAGEWGFTDPAKRRFRATMAHIADLALGDAERPRVTRAGKDRRASVRLPPDLRKRIDAIPGKSRTAKVEQLLVEALNARGVGMSRV